ncbi:hypothetical protein C8Q80DRAFT_612879 [Daedaleopsis nitida]|nr:hypothetical protein C8Q80DRAFT_612879 [Daedaleopsis nitida]
MHLSDLDNDVLRHICDYLFGNTALNFALVSKRFHVLAICRVVAYFAANTPMMLRTFHRYVLHAPRPLAQYIESINLGFLNLYPSDKSTEELIDMSEYAHPFDNDAVQLLTGLLKEGHNLRKLVLYPCGYLLAQSSRFRSLAAALTSDTLRCLQEVELTKVDSTVVEVVRRTRWDLRELTLGFLSLRTDGLDGVSFQLLLDALSNFPRLHTLAVNSYTFKDWPEYLYTVPRHPAQLYPSIRRLYFSYANTLPAMALVGRCPNAETVWLNPVSVTVANKLRTPGTIPLPFATIPTLHRLCADVDVMYKACCKYPFVGFTAVHRWITPRRHSVAHPDGENRREVIALLSVLQVLSPVWAELSLVIGDAPMRFWREVPERAPRLRILDLTISISQLNQVYADNLDNIPDAIKSLPLVYLGLRVYDLPHRSHVYDFNVHEYSRDDNGDYIYDFPQEVEDEFRKTCDAAVVTFPEKCAQAIPTLMFIALSHTFSTGSGFVEDTWMEEDIDLLPYHERELRKKRMWRVSREGGESRLQRLDTTHVHRLKECLEECHDEKDTMDAISALHKVLKPWSSQLRITSSTDHRAENGTR